jgi:hypothetical protein
MSGPFGKKRLRLELLESRALMSIVTGDFNGDGLEDMAVGAPGEVIRGLGSAGGVSVIYGSLTGLDPAGNQFITQDGAVPDTAEAGDRFGESMAVGDFNRDGFDDLAVAAPGETLGAFVGTGAVFVLNGSANGLLTGGSIQVDQDSVLAGVAIAGTNQSGDEFGSALAAGDINGDGVDDLVVGIPRQDLNGFGDAGAFNVIYGAVGGLTGANNRSFSLDTGTILGATGLGDRFGEAVAVGDINGDGFADVAVGAPGDRVGNADGAGAVNILFGAAAGLTDVGNERWHQDSVGPNGLPIEGVAEAGDGFASTLVMADFDDDGNVDVAAGVPYEDINTLGDAGAVNVIRGSVLGLTDNGNQRWHQNSGTILGTVEANDQFGGSLAAGDLDGDGDTDLIVGVRYEDINGTGDAGAVNVIYSGGAGIGLSDVGNQRWHQNSAGVEDSAEVGDEFGSSLAAGDFNGDGVVDVAIGVSGENGGAGAVNALYGTVTGLDATDDQLWSQDGLLMGGIFIGDIDDTSEAGDGFGG